MNFQNPVVKAPIWQADLPPSRRSGPTCLQRQVRMISVPVNAMLQSSEKDRIETLMVVPLIQGTLRYADARLWSD
jgi:hypothetical protein